jgi:hypothetical protein
LSAPGDWARGYARQSRADLDAYDALCTMAELPECQRLHFLQMACEKLCKAHLCQSGSDPVDLRSSHAYVGRVLPVVVRQQFAHSPDQSLKAWRWVLSHVPPLAREIELLAPAVDDGGDRPDNCEYPWEDRSGTLNVPADHSFANLGLLTTPAGRVLMKILRRSIQDMA